MGEDVFFQDLAVLSAMAGLVAILFARMRWPKVLGYIAVGVLMNQYTWGGSFLINEQSVHLTGQIGVVYLMLTMGLDFSTSQIKRIKSVAMPIALVDTVIMTWLGYTVGTCVFHWDMVPSLFLGIAICDSATTMLAKVIDEMKWGDKPFVRYVLGTSVCEDIVCVGLLALAVGVANGQGLSLMAAGTSLGGLFVFFLAVFVFGLVMVPRLFKSVAKTRDDEALLLALTGVCFLVSWAAMKLNYSLALGAFIVGIIGSSSDVRERLVALVTPLKSLNAAVFFVSIGLVMDPWGCLREWPSVLLLTVLVIVGKFLNCTITALLTGQSIRTAVQMGMSLAQIGEFAFMVALLYYGATGDKDCPMYDIVVAVSLITTLINPLMIRWSVPVSEWVEDHLPTITRGHFETYRGFVMKLQTSDREIVAHRVVRLGFIQLGVIGVLIFAVSLVFLRLEQYDWSNFSAFFNTHKRIAFCLLANIFIVAMLIPTLRIGRTIGRAFALVLVGREGTKWNQSIRNLITLATVAGVVALLFFETSMVNVNLAPEQLWARWMIRAILFAIAVFGWRHFAKAIDRANTRFTEALSAEERREKIGKMMTFTIPEDRMSRLTLAANSVVVGETVVSLNIRAKTGVSVAAIERGDTILNNVGPDTVFQVGDTLVVVGEGHQVAALKDLLGIVS